MTFFGEPRTEYSHDGGITWYEGGNTIGPSYLMRIITSDCVVIYSAHAVEVEQPCPGCDGTGRQKYHRWQAEKK